METDRPIIDLQDSETASALDEQSFWSSQFGAYLLERVPMSRGSTVLDLACGTGFPLIELAQRLGSSCVCIGLDLWWQALERAAQKKRVYGIDNASLVRGDGARLPFGDQCFDSVVSNVGVNNFADAETAMAEVFRTVKPGGRLVLTTNVKGHMKEFYDVYSEIILSTDRSDYAEGLRANEDHRGTRESVLALVTSAGFRIRETAEGEFRFRYLDGTSFLECFLTRLGFLEGWTSFLDPSDRPEILARLEEGLNRRAQAEGTLIFTVPILYVEGSRDS